ncbi:hypothetical protein ScPMuIL_006332 [Solemya velum]
MLQTYHWVFAASLVCLAATERIGYFDYTISDFNCGTFYMGGQDMLVVEGTPSSLLELCQNNLYISKDIIPGDAATHKMVSFDLSELDPTLPTHGISIEGVSVADQRLVIDESTHIPITDWNNLPCGLSALTMKVSDNTPDVGTPASVKIPIVIPCNPTNGEYKGRERHTDTETYIERDIDRQRDAHTYIQTYIETYIETARKGDRERDRQIEKQTDRDRQRETERDGQTEKDRLGEKQTERDRQRGRQTYIQTERQIQRDADRFKLVNNGPDVFKKTAEQSPRLVIAFLKPMESTYTSMYPSSFTPECALIFMNENTAEIPAMGELKQMTPHEEIMFDPEGPKVCGDAKLIFQLDPLQEYGMGSSQEFDVFVTCDTTEGAPPFLILNDIGSDVVIYKKDSASQPRYWHYVGLDDAWHVVDHYNEQSVVKRLMTNKLVGKMLQRHEGNIAGLIGELLMPDYGSSSGTYYTDYEMEIDAMITEAENLFLTSAADYNSIDFMSVGYQEDYGTLTSLKEAIRRGMQAAVLVATYGPASFDMVKQIETYQAIAYKTTQNLRKKIYQMEPATGDVEQLAEVVSTIWALCKMDSTGSTDDFLSYQAQEVLRKLIPMILSPGTTTCPHGPELEMLNNALGIIMRPRSNFEGTQTGNTRQMNDLVRKYLKLGGEQVYTKSTVQTAGYSGYSCVKHPFSISPFDMQGTYWRRSGDDLQIGFGDGDVYWTKFATFYCSECPSDNYPDATIATKTASACLHFTPLSSSQMRDQICTNLALATARSPTTRRRPAIVISNNTDTRTKRYANVRCRKMSAMLSLTNHRTSIPSADLPEQPASTDQRPPPI